MNIQAKPSGKISQHTLYSVMLIVTISQPLLDIFSFFMNGYNLNSISTIIRMGFLLFLIVYTFLITTHRKIYYITVLSFALFFVLHAAGNMQRGYISILNDVAMYSRIIYIPVYIIFFYETWLRLRSFVDQKELIKMVNNLAVINFIIISASIGLSYLLNIPSYSYYNPEVGFFGVKGWFLVANSQSAIVSLLACISILYSYRGYKERPVFSLLLFSLSIASMFMFGTKLALYTIFLFLAAFIVMLLFSKKLTKGILVFLVAVLALVFFLRPYSPSATNLMYMGESFDEWQNDFDDIENSHGVKPPEGENGLQYNYEFYSENKEMYNEIYGLYLTPLINEFGLDAVVDKYDYSLEAYKLIDNRIMKVNASSLAFNQGSTLQKLFGMEQSRYIIDGENFDVENDLHGVFFSYGYVGFAITVLFFLYLIIRGIYNYFFVKERRFSINLAVYLVVLILLIGAAHYSGNVIKRPNVAFYIGLVSAYILFTTKGFLKGGQLND